MRVDHLSFEPAIKQLWCLMRLSETMKIWLRVWLTVTLYQLMREYLSNDRKCLPGIRPSQLSLSSRISFLLLHIYLNQVRKIPRSQGKMLKSSRPIPDNYECWVQNRPYLKKKPTDAHVSKFKLIKYLKQWTEPSVHEIYPNNIFSINWLLWTSYLQKTLEL